MIEKVRQGCAIVADSASRVRINYDAVPGYVHTLPLDKFKGAKHDPACHYLDHGDDTAAFFVVLDTINFGSGYFPHLKKRPGKSGYFSLACSLKEYFERNGVPTPEFLSEISSEACLKMFRQDPGNHVARQLMGLFSQALRALGSYVMTHFNGSFVALIKAADRSAESLVRILAGMPFFRDVSRYGPLEVYFLKRAQLMVADLALAFEGKGLGHFSGLEMLTIFADNVLPMCSGSMASCFMKTNLHPALTPAS